MPRKNPGRFDPGSFRPGSFWPNFGVGRFGLVGGSIWPWVVSVEVYTKM